MGVRVDSGTPALAQPARATETRAIISKWRQVFGPGVLAFTRITYIEIREGYRTDSCEEGQPLSETVCYQSRAIRPPPRASAQELTL